MRTCTKLALATVVLLNAGLAQANELVGKATPACVEVEVDGVRAPSYNCLSEKLQPTPTPGGTTKPQMGSEAIIQRPSNQLGVFNRAATGHRMGNNFGTSVYPQRPPEKP